MSYPLVLESRKRWRAGSPASWVWLILVVAAATLSAVTLVGCDPEPEALAPKEQTFAELRLIRRAVTIQPAEQEKRAPFFRERLTDGTRVEIAAGGLARIRRDVGATALVAGEASLRMRASGWELTSGRYFFETSAPEPSSLQTPSGTLGLSRVRCALEVNGDRTWAYVLDGELRVPGKDGSDDLVARAGEAMTLSGDATAPTISVSPVIAWEDWTGGLASPAAAAQPAPFGVGTVGARTPGASGTPHTPLSIQRLDVRVTVTQDFAVTEVDQTFFNPSSEVVEGVYRFRTPPGASLERFGVDRDGSVMWGYVKEKKAASAQYEANVYQGSTEDPALLEWEEPGVYRARLYPIGPGQSRQVVVRYTEWLGRTGDKGERRLLTYPMAAEGAAGSLPVIEELVIDIDLRDAGATEVRAGMDATREGDMLRIRRHDFTPRADLAVELFDDGLVNLRGYRAPHEIDLDALPSSEHAEAQRLSKGESDYLLVPIRPSDVPRAEGGLDLAIVVDTSAATDGASLALARSTTRALLSHLGKEDRAVVYAGADGLRPVGAGALKALSDQDKQAILKQLAEAPRGGATDLGAVLSEAASKLEEGRRSALVYVGDGRPTVGELRLATLRERLDKLPRPVRIFSLGIGADVDMALLDGLGRGAFARRIGSAHQAATAALDLLEQAERPAWLAADVDLGPNVERVYPRDVSTLVADEPLIVVGRIAKDADPPTKISVRGAGGVTEHELKTTPLKDSGDLRRRWAEGRLRQLLDEDVGRAALVDLGMRQGIITPVTSLYVPTTSEMTPEDRRRLRRQKKERAKGKANAARKSAEDFGIIGLLGGDDDATASADAAERDVVDSEDTDEAPEEAEEDWDVDGADNKRAKADEPEPDAKPEQVAAAATAMPLGSETKEITPQAPAKPALPKPSFAPIAKVPTTTTGASAPAEPAVALPHLEGGTGMRAEEAPPLGKDKNEADTLAPPTDDAGAFGGAGNAIADRGGLRFNLDIDRAQRRRGDGADIVVVVVGDVSPTPSPCSPAAHLPLERRVALWRERLAQTGGYPTAVADVYRAALQRCEARTWRERTRLLSLMLDAIPSVSMRVDLWREMRNEMRAADTLYRGILARLQTPDDKRELSQALGLRTMDRQTLENALKEVEDDGAAQVEVLARFAHRFPDDTELAVMLLHAYEDVGALSKALAVAHQLRQRADVDAQLLTTVGELYLRFADRMRTSDKVEADRLVGEARRAFGEIVEFAPTDPIARRRLGDLYRSHGWYEAASRQYETLAQLEPDDPTVALLQAAASQGLGKLEQAVRLAEQGAGAGAPDVAQGPAVTARAIAATYLAWGSLDARKAKDKELSERLDARRKRVLNVGRSADAANTKGRTRVAMTWSHPDLHPTLWTNALGSPMPAEEGDAVLGVFQANVPDRPGSWLELRVEPGQRDRMVRLNAEVTLTIVIAEGTGDERIVRKRMRLAELLNESNVVRFDLKGERVSQ